MRWGSRGVMRRSSSSSADQTVDQGSTRTMPANLRGLTQPGPHLVPGQETITHTQLIRQMVGAGSQAHSSASSKDGGWVEEEEEGVAGRVIRCGGDCWH